MKPSTHTDKPLASIIINNYNYGRFLGEAIDSALSQTYPNIEVIVVDDGSTDNSREVIRSYGNQIIALLKENGGQVSTFNVGFSASKGNIICLLDSDDTYLPEKVAEAVNAFEAYPDIDWFFHCIMRMDTNTNTFLQSYPEGLPSRKIDFREQIKRAKLPAFAPATSGLCFKRSLIQQVFPVPDAEGTVFLDYYLKITALALGKGFFLDKVLVIQKIHGNNAFTLSDGNKYWVWLSNTTILTAYWVRYRFPGLKRFTNKIFGMGLSDYRKAGVVDIKCEEIVKSYLSTTSILERLEIYIRFFYHVNPLFSSIRSWRLINFQKRAKLGKT